MLKHMAAHNAARAFAAGESVTPLEPESVSAVESISALPAVPWTASVPQSPN